VVAVAGFPKIATRDRPALLAASAANLQPAPMPPVVLQPAPCSAYHCREFAGGDIPPLSCFPGSVLLLLQGISSKIRHRSDKKLPFHISWNETRTKSRGNTGKIA
jgi:hypothetical protein